MASYQDFQLIQTAVNKAMDDYGEKYRFDRKDAGFYWFVAENIFNLQEDEIDGAYIHTLKPKQELKECLDDNGINAIIIENNSINIMSFRYIDSFEVSKNNYFPENELDKVLLFLENLSNKEYDKFNRRLQEKCLEIFLMQEKGQYFSFNLYFVGNYFNGVQSDKIEEFEKKLKHKKMHKGVSIKFLQLDDLVEKIIDRSLSVDVKIKSIADNFFEKNEGGNKALIIELYAKDIVRMVSDSEFLRKNTQATLTQIRESSIEEGVFEENVRIYLHQRTNVNKSIKKTAMDDVESSNFFFYNNGITIICDSIRYQGKKDVSIVLKNIQIVNGGQTIHSLKEALEQNDNIENVSVLCKIYQTDSKKLKARISEFTNNQNPVKGRDIRSIDEVQIKLENEFKILGYYYERKKNQYKNHPKRKRLDSEKIGQILLAYKGKPAEVRNNKGLVFDLEYENIFSSEINAKDILKIYKLYLFIEEKKIDLEEYYFFLKYATYYILYFYSLAAERGLCNIEDRISVEKNYNEALEIMKDIVEKERKKQSERFLESVLFKGKMLQVELLNYMAKKY